MNLLHLGKYNNVLIVDERTLVAAATRADMERFLGFDPETGRSMADGLTGPLAAAPEDLATAIIVSGHALMFQFDLIGLTGGNPNLIATPGAFDEIEGQMNAAFDEASRMPPLATVLVGATAGTLFAEDAASGSAGAPVAHAVLMAVPLDEGSVETVADVVEERWGAGGPAGQPTGEERTYRELFPEIGVKVASGAVVAELTPAPDGSAYSPTSMLRSRNLTLLAWHWGL